ncbi:hypothetical protein BV22DRAFT_1040348 [Leucogyrophana mollusca]|uniref:Uncharacterized protein n=1 Tax=Leucogyrophana mollusca TaxID=85980 RepID=A0ACB8B3P3_9AGAM|nr:hypothetical protein BV22DRAFT_1040348 [Leucogyrophana mollusca]
MNTVAPFVSTLHSVVLWASDEEGALANSKRLSVRQQHLDNVNRLIAQNILGTAHEECTKADSLTAVAGDGIMIPESVRAEAADKVRCLLRDL